MDPTPRPSRKVRKALHHQLVALVTIGVLADEATRAHSHATLSGPNGTRIAAKIDGTVAAALWREGVKAYIEWAPPEWQMTWSEAAKNGWPEFLLSDRYHVFVHRRDDMKKSARMKALDYGLPDDYMEFEQPLLPGMEASEQKQKARIVVRVLAIHDPHGRMVAAEVVAPHGKTVRWAFVISADEVQRRKAEWVLSNTPWLDDLNLLGSVQPPENQPILPAIGTTAPPTAPPIVAQDDEAEAEESTGRRFSPTERTQRPPTEETATEGDAQAGTDTTGTDAGSLN